MKNLYFFLLVLSIISCKENNSIKITKSILLNKDTIASNRVKWQMDTIGWIDNFREFRKAVYQKDKKKVKQYIDFPIRNENNEIWYLVYGTDDKEINRISDKIEPFTENDFDKYFDKIFTKRFVNTILKIKSEDLFKNKSVETIDFTEGSNTTYKMYGNYDQAEKKLTLNLASKTVIKDDNGEVQDGGEFNIIYQFDILKGKLKFRGVMLAG